MVGRGPGRASVWRREEAKNRRSGEEMAEESQIALAPEPDCLALSLTRCATLNRSVFLLKLQFPLKNGQNLISLGCYVELMYTYTRVCVLV